MNETVGQPRKNVNLAALEIFTRVHQIYIDFFKRRFFERPYDFLMWLGLKTPQTKFYENPKILKGG